MGWRGKICAFQAMSIVSVSSPACCATRRGYFHVSDIRKQTFSSIFLILHPTSIHQIFLCVMSLPECVLNIASYSKIPRGSTAAVQPDQNETPLSQTNIIPSRTPLLPHYVQASSQAPPLVSQALRSETGERRGSSWSSRVHSSAIKDNYCSGVSVCDRPFPVPTGLAGHSRVAENRWRRVVKRSKNIWIPSNIHSCICQWRGRERQSDE